MKDVLDAVDNGGPVVPENFILVDSRDEVETAHHPVRCLRSSNCSGRSSPTCSGRGVSLKSRTSFSGISSILPCGVYRTIGGFVGVTEHCWYESLWPSLLDLSRVVQPDTILRW